MVSKIHVSEAWAEDLLIWPLTLDDDYSVRSAYHMLAADEANTNLSSSSLDSSYSVWKENWKIRHFIWRAAKDSLPIKQYLKSHHIPMDETCTLCDDHQETLMNCLWLCDHA